MISKLTKKAIFLVFLTLSLFLILPSQVFAEDNPIYSDNTLFISRIIEKEYPKLSHNSFLNMPRIDTLEQDGLYQNVALEFDQAVDAWRLLHFNVSSPINDQLAPILHELRRYQNFHHQLVIF